MDDEDFAGNGWFMNTIFIGLPSLCMLSFCILSLLKITSATDIWAVNLNDLDNKPLVNIDDENEINCIDLVAENGTCCDDNGNVYIFANNFNDFKIKKQFNQQHENICMNVKLRPNISTEGIFYFNFNI